MKNPRQPIVGKKFKMLTVVSFSHVNETRHAVYNCICDCGKSHTVVGRYLIDGRSGSCGCMKKKMLNKVGSLFISPYKETQ